MLVLLLGATVGPAQGVADLLRDEGRIRGDSDAPVTLIEYSDFTCGFCVKFYREVWPKLNARYVKTGKVRFVYRDFPRSLGGKGVTLAIVARCAGEQDRYWQMHDFLFENGVDLSVRDLENGGVVQTLDLDRSAFVTCVQERRHVRDIFGDRREGADLGIRGTPGFVLMLTNPSSKTPVLVIPGAFPYEVFEQHIERLLAHVK